MRLVAILCAAFLSIHASAETAAGRMWTELKAKRDLVPSVHQEFDVSQTTKSRTASQSSTRHVTLDVAPGQWREKSASGSGSRIRIFDGKDLFFMEEGGDEYVRVKRHAKDPDPVPSAYLSIEVDWSKAGEVEHRPCGLAEKDDACVVLQVPMKRWSRTSGMSSVTTLLDGGASILIDTSNGLILSLRTVETIQNSRGAFQSEARYVMRHMTYGPVADAGLFHPPSDLREVKELSKWNVAKIRKQLAGKPAPELTVTDIEGKPIALSSFKGKTVLLDFWTTWCPPCRADAPALEKLNRKYGEHELVIIGISVSEERSIVEQYLKQHPHSYPVVLTTENELPPAYQVGEFPTYMVIGPDGTLTSAVDGDQGFAELRKLLKKAGLDIE
jgi:thiol-disulfide isomerase/thioredoxin